MAKLILIAVDLQKDFIDGALGTKEAQGIVPAAAARIRDLRGAGAEIYATLDTHGEDYMQTREGRKLPVPHCIRGTDGWQLDASVMAALEGRAFTAIEKNTFGSDSLPEVVKKLSGGEDFTVTFIGLCTDICVVSNALLLKAFFPEVPMRVDSRCCAGVTPRKHEAALETLRSCQFEVL